MIFVGDLYQLPPVLQKPIYADYYDEIFNIHHLWRTFKFCELTEVMRQREDSSFIDLLNNVRIGELSPNDVDVINSRVIDKTDDNYPVDALHIFAENEPARVHNQTMLETIDQTVLTIEAIDQVPNSVPDHIYDIILNMSLSQTKGLIFHLKVKIGARTMLTSNVDLSDNLNNGQIGTIMHIYYKNEKVEAIIIKFDDPKAGLKKKQSQLERYYDAVPIERVTLDIRTNTKKDSAPAIKRTQFPLTLSWGCTVHKVQGLSLDQIVLSCDLLKQRSFNPGQFYVGISRATSLEGLFLTGKFDKKVIVVDERVKTEYDYLRQEQMLESLNGEDQLENKVFLEFKICNVQSLSRHIVDMRSDPSFTSSDIILCTETQLTNELTDVHLEDFNYFLNNNEDRFLGLAVYYKEQIDLIREFDGNGFSLFKTNVETFELTVMLLYRKNNTLIPEFYDLLRYLTSTYDIDLIVGDFNVQPNENLRNVLNLYDQLIERPTFISGSILDHVYVKKSMLSKCLIKADVESVFFSQHDSVKITFESN